ncbi:hypothetical protein MMT35_20040, partial [Escherichia coli]|nr:hypothetical protein [Escherichia coli]
ALTFQNHTNCPLTDLGGKTSIFSHPVYLFLREFSLQDFRGGSLPATVSVISLTCWLTVKPYCVMHPAKNASRVKKTVVCS